jgi:serine/threonine protein kinase
MQLISAVVFQGFEPNLIARCFVTVRESLIEVRTEAVRTDCLDIKPENLFLDGDGNLKIGDFGLAALFEHNGKYRTLRNVCGSPPYVAPEAPMLTSMFTDVQGRPESRRVPRPSRRRLVVWCRALCPPRRQYPLGRTNCIQSRISYLQDRRLDLPPVRSVEQTQSLSIMYLPTQLLFLMLALICALMRIDVDERMTLDAAMQHPWVRR